MEGCDIRTLPLPLSSLPLLLSSLPLLLSSLPLLLSSLPLPLSSLPLPLSTLNYSVHVVLLLTVTRLVCSLIDCAGLEEDVPKLLIREEDLGIPVRC